LIGRGVRARRGLVALGLGVDATVVLVDLLSRGTPIPLAPLAIAPLLPAVAGLLGATACLAVLSFVLAFAIVAADHHLTQTDELVPLVTVGVIGGLAIVGTRLRLRADALAQALDALPDAVTIQGLGGAVIYGNRAAAGLATAQGRLRRDAADDYLARMEVTFEGGEPLDPGKMPAQRLLAGQDAEPVVVRSLDPSSGAVTWSRVQASPLRTPEGKVRSAVNVIEDITTVKQAEGRAAFLADASALLASSLDTSLTLRRTADLVVPELADWCSVELLTPSGRVEPVALAHVDPKMVALAEDVRRRYPADLSRDDGIGYVLRHNEPLLIDVIPHEQLADVAVDAEHLALLEQIGLSSAIVVPLAIGSRVIGALTWVRSTPERPYGPDDLETAEGVATRAAVAVENARVHGAREEVATVLQEALLPAALPAAPGWELAAHYRATGEANEVGGDFYDVVVLDDGAVVALVGDVAGKGARAAALTARTRHTLVAAAALNGGDPRAGLDLVSAALQATDTLELCSVAVVVARGADLDVVSAGHPLPLVLRDGVLFEVGRTSPMLGAAPPEQVWATTTTRLLPGDLVVLHTDGITDAVGATERFGDARLRAALRDGSPGAQDAVDRLVAAVDVFEEGPQADDRALLALRRVA
jgi:PAS domain-containing protein